MRILICGDRNYTDYKRILGFLKEYKRKHSELVVIEGGAKGADKLAKRAADELKIPVVEYQADWLGLGRAAGPIRNQKMIDEGKPDIIVAFHDDIESSKGTKDMINRAKKLNIRWLVINSLAW